MRNMHTMHALRLTPAPQCTSTAVAHATARQGRQPCCVSAKGAAGQRVSSVLNAYSPSLRHSRPQPRTRPAHTGDAQHVQQHPTARRTLLEALAVCYELKARVEVRADVGGVSVCASDRRRRRPAIGNDS
jgi:hypothetical protein